VRQVQKRRVGGTAALSQGPPALREAPTSEPRHASHFSRRGFLLLALASAVVGFDQWSKSWAQHALARGPLHLAGPLNLVLTYNKGAAFSLGSGATPVVIALAVALAALVLWHWRRLSSGAASWAYVAGFGLLSGGAVSNLCDRLLRHHHGAVVDFIQVASWWPVFNIADAAITLGAVTVAVKAVLSSPARGRRQQ
jgi:signal peptidase II